MKSLTALLILAIAIPCFAQEEPLSHSPAGNRNRAIGLAYGTGLTAGSYYIARRILPKSMSKYHNRGASAAIGFVVGLAGCIALSYYHNNITDKCDPLWLEGSQRPEYMMFATIPLTCFLFGRNEIKHYRNPKTD